jgi:BON domain-containing protein
MAQYDRDARGERNRDDVSEARQRQWRAEGIDDRREHERRWEERQASQGGESWRGGEYRGSEGYRGGEAYRGRDYRGDEYRGEGYGGTEDYRISGSYRGGERHGGGERYGGGDYRGSEGYRSGADYQHGGGGEGYRGGADYRYGGGEGYRGGEYGGGSGGYTRDLGRHEGGRFGGYTRGGSHRGATPEDWFDESRRDFRGAWSGGGGEERWGRDLGERERGGREDDRGLIERVGDRLREGMHRIGKGPKGYKRSDERIREDVCERIARSGIDADEVEVEVQGGEVTLTGTIRSRDEKRRLEDTIEDVFGVDEVQNHLRVTRPGEQGQYGGTQTGASTSGAPSVTNTVQ